MKKLKNLATTLSIIFAFSLSTQAQKNYSKDADKAAASKEYFSAIELYKKALSKTNKKEDKALVQFKIANCFKQINDSKQAEAWYIKTIKAKHPDPLAVLYLADAKKANQKYDEAIIEYTNYQKQVPEDNRGEQGIKSCELAQKWKDHPNRYKVENMALINSKSADFAPTYSDKKHNALIFTSTREEATGGKQDATIGQEYSDLFETKMDKNGKWSTPSNLPAPINTSDNEGTADITKKMTTMYFSRCADVKKKTLNCQLYLSNKKGTTWDEPVLLPFNVDSFQFSHPSISDDEQTLYFTSNMTGSLGGTDIWMSTFDKKEKAWGVPVNLGPTVNTEGTEMYPFIREDGTLFFSSNRHIGMGGLDIFKVTKTSDNKWGEAINMEAPINSPGDDFGIIFEGKKDRGYLSSNREGGKGNDDIYSFAMPPILFTLQGVVTDKETRLPIPEANIKLVGSDGSSIDIKTDKAGFYDFAANGKARYINEKTSYAITASAKDYLNSEKATETTVGVTEAKTFVHDFVLQNASASTFIRFPEVLYDLDKFFLRPESKDSLNFLYQTLINNPTIVIELSSHTDSRSSDEYNKSLSQNRAKSCVDYLVNEKKIPLARLKPVGYGETKLLIKDDVIDKLPTVEEKEAAHQKNRRTVFRVLSWDYVDPNAPKDQPKSTVKPKVYGEEEGYEEEDTTTEQPKEEKKVEQKITPVVPQKKQPK